MKYIDSEIIWQRKIGPLVYVYIMLIIVINLSLITFCMLAYYKTYYTVKGIVIEENNHYYIRAYIPIDDIKYIINNSDVKINNIHYKYSIISIDSEYFTDDITTYQIVKIEVELQNKYKYNNLTLSLNFQKENKRIIDYILKK